MPEAQRQPSDAAPSIAERYAATRRLSEALVAPLSEADATLQSMADASPAKWHLAHTTWFFETFLLRDRLPGYRLYDEQWSFLFNSYYEAEGERILRARRGMLSRPTLAEIVAWRAHVDAAMARLLADSAGAGLVELGIAHEQQHQELLLTDIKHALFQNPLGPAMWQAPAPAASTHQDRAASEWHEHPGGIVMIGHQGKGFAFDNEGPPHRVLLEPFALAGHLVTNGEWHRFIADGGYRTASLWLSDGWDWVRRKGITAPLYWRNDEHFTHSGWQPRDPAAPVGHISYYEADAFAAWAGERLPTEFEWEAIGQGHDPCAGNQLDAGDSRAGPGIACVELVAGARIVALTDRFPFELGRQPLAGPRGEGIGFVIRDVAHRGGGIARLPARVGEMLVVPPVERRGDAFAPDPVPAVGQPQRRGAIAAVGDEPVPFAVGHQVPGQRERFEQHAVRRALVVESEALALVADHDDAAGMLVPLGCGAVLMRRSRRRRRLPHRRSERVLEQRVLDVGQQQLLMLLLVRDAELDQPGAGGIGQQPRHRRVDVRAPRHDLGQSRARQHAASRAQDALALGLVIGIEQERPLLVVEPVTRQPVAQQERLEEPGGVREVPFGRRGVGHRLQRRVRFGERRDERFAEPPGRGVAFGDRRRGVARLALGFGQSGLPRLRAPKDGAAKRQRKVWPSLNVPGLYQAARFCRSVISRLSISASRNASSSDCAALRRGSQCV